MAAVSGVVTWLTCAKERCLPHPSIPFVSSSPASPCPRTPRSLFLGRSELGSSPAAAHEKTRHFVDENRQLLRKSRKSPGSGYFAVDQ
jgi:hypothetical protein